MAAGLGGRESNKGNPAARHYTGMSAAAERGMVTRIMRGTEIYIFHGSHVGRSRDKAIRALTEEPPPTRNH